MTQAVKQLQVVLKVFAKTDARVKKNALAGNTVGFQLGCYITENAGDIPQGIVIVGILLHGLGAIGHMHNDITRLGFCKDWQHVAKIEGPGDVIDDGGTGFDGFSGDLRFLGIDGDGDVEGLGESFNDGDDAVEFFVLIDAVGTGTSTFAADIDDVGTVFNELGCMGYGKFGIGVAIGEAVRRYIENAHDERLLIEIQVIRAAGP